MRRLLTFLKNSPRAIIRGEFILRLQVDKLFMHILWLFVLVWLAIWLNIRIDSTLTQVEQNKAVLNDLAIRHAEKTGELARLNRISTVQENLSRLGSEVDIPDVPATRISRKR